MKSSTILPVAALASVVQAIGPSPLSASSLMTHSPSSGPPLETTSLPSAPSARSSSSSNQAVEAHTLSSLSTAHSSSPSSPAATAIPHAGLYSARPSSSHPFAGRISVDDVRPKENPCVCRDDHQDPPCCHKEICWQTFTRPLLPYPSLVLDTSKKPVPTPRDPSSKPHRAVPLYPPDYKRKHHMPTYAITVFEPEATCPAGLTCQPGNGYIEDKSAVREANVPWPAPLVCANHWVGGRGCWTECDKPHPKQATRVCPGGYSFQRKGSAPAPNPESCEQQPPHKHRPAPGQQPAPPAAYPEHAPVPAPMPPSLPFIPPPAAQPPPAAPAVVVLPPPVFPPAVGQPPVATPDPAAQLPAAQVQSPMHLEPAREVLPAPSHHRHVDEPVGALEPVTKADPGLSTPAAAIAMMFAGGLGFVMV